MNNNRSPWAWVPTLYFAEGLPYVIVMTVSLVLYKQMGLSNADITLYTSWLYLPWVIKPLWSPFVDLVKTKRWWVVTMQLLVGAALGGVAFTIPTSFWLQGSLAFFWLMAFASATHDIAADGFYMLGLDQHQQAWFVGIRSTFYRVHTLWAGRTHYDSRKPASRVERQYPLLLGPCLLWHCRTDPRPVAVARLYPPPTLRRQSSRAATDALRHRQ